ncbi:MAG: hypothetical protein K1Y36_27430 [Blastocatellia bacterium]|nr:hypothetical protein [Blastocatellia bacterium]
MKSFRYKLKPSVRIAARFGQWLRICREPSQAGLHESREACRLQWFSLNYLPQAAEPPAAKAGREDVERARGKAQVLQDVLPRLGKALLSQNFRVTIENRPAERFPEKPEEPQSVHSRTVGGPPPSKNPPGR